MQRFAQNFGQVFDNHSQNNAAEKYKFNVENRDLLINELS